MCRIGVDHELDDPVDCTFYSMHKHFELLIGVNKTMKATATRTTAMTDDGSY